MIICIQEKINAAGNYFEESASQKLEFILKEQQFEHHSQSLKYKFDILRSIKLKVKQTGTQDQQDESASTVSGNTTQSKNNKGQNNSSNVDSWINLLKSDVKKIKKYII